MAAQSRVWVEQEPVDGHVGAVADSLGLPLPLAKVLVRRIGSDPEQLKEFLAPEKHQLTDPFELPDMGKAVSRIWESLLANERILVFGDYDVDGVTSTAFLTRILRKLGGEVTWFIPHRIEDGYGLSVDTVRRCVERDHPKLIVTVDCGTGSVEAVEEARRLGVEVIVTDHHESGSGQVANAHAVVNPKVGNKESLKILAGVGVAFKLSHALIRYGREHEYPQSRTANMRPWMYLVALGTVADMVPLVGENRFLVRYGMEILNSRKREPGIQALIHATRIDQEITSYHVGFVLGPRINAAGRMGSPDRALRLLLTDSTREAQDLARRLDEANQKRQAIEEGIRLEAEETLQESFDPNSPGVIVVGKRGWHSGVVGIVASRLVRKYHRPAIVISIDERDGIGRGSCRSIEGFDLIAELGAVGDLLLKHGGHRMAAGLDVREQDLTAFRTAINERAKQVLADAELRPTQVIDGWVQIEDLTKEFLRAQERLMPFGHQNPVPVWALRRIRPHKMQKVGKEGRHLRLVFHTPHGVQDAIVFGYGDREPPDGDIDIAFQLRRNVFRGEERLQLMVQDLRPSR